MDSGIIFRKYEPGDFTALEEIFFSNVPLYFGKEEWPDFAEFLKSDIGTDCCYDVVLLNGKIIGAGGVAKKDDGRVVMCWGMIDKKAHKKGFGKALLEHRIDLAESTYPGKLIEVDTSQHAFGFFEKYGFRTTGVEPDYWADGLDLYKMERKH